MHWLAFFSAMNKQNKKTSIIKNKKTKNTKLLLSLLLVVVLWGTVLIQSSAKFGTQADGGLQVYEPFLQPFCAAGRILLVSRKLYVLSVIVDVNL